MLGELLFEKRPACIVERGDERLSRFKRGRPERLLRSGLDRRRKRR
jgi:hypothetical protein